MHFNRYPFVVKCILFNNIFPNLHMGNYVHTLDSSSKNQQILDASRQVTAAGLGKCEQKRVCLSLLCTGRGGAATCIHLSSRDSFDPNSWNPMYAHILSC